MEPRDPSDPSAASPRGLSRAATERKSPWQPPQILLYGGLRYLVRGASGKGGDNQGGKFGKMDQGGN